MSRYARRGEDLAAGSYENLRIQLDEPLQNDDTLVPMAHKDTNDNQQYDFVQSSGEADGPFVNTDGDAVTDNAQVELSNDANVAFEAQASGGTTVVVDEVFLPEGGFVTAHDSTLEDGAVIESIRGTSDYLAPGLHRNVVVTLDTPLSEDDTIYAMAHLDTNGNQMYDFVTSEGASDGPYVAAGMPVMDSEDSGMDGENSSSSADDGGPEFGVLPAVVAVLGAGFIALRRRS